MGNGRVKYLIGIGGMLVGGAIVASGQPVIGGILLLAMVVLMAAWPGGR
jgi:hypothetical protein